MDKVIFTCVIKQPWQENNDFSGKTSLVPSYLKRYDQDMISPRSNYARVLWGAYLLWAKNILLSQESYSILQMTQDLLQHEHQERVSGTIYLPIVSFLWGMRIPVRFLGTGWMLVGGGAAVWTLAQRC